MGRGDTSTKDFNRDDLNTVSHDLQELGAAITEEEVRNSIDEMPSDKGPGLDGFTGMFSINVGTL